MDFNVLVDALKANFSIPFAVVCLLLLGSEFMGTKENVKASSWYGLFKTVLNTIKDQMMPQKPQEPTDKQ